MVLIVSHGSLSVYKATLVFDRFHSFLGSHCFLTDINNNIVTHGNCPDLTTLPYIRTILLHSTALRNANDSPRIPDAFQDTSPALAHFRFRQGCSGLTRLPDALPASRDYAQPSAPTAALRATQQLHFTLPGVRRRFTSLPGDRYSARLAERGMLTRRR